MSDAMHALRAATRDIHDQFEQGLKVARPDAGRAEYLGFISAMWGWLKPFEQELWDAPWPEEMRAEERAGKAAWLERDLAAAGLDAPVLAELPQAGSRPPLGSRAQRFGVAYVLEGAQLGSQVLARTLAPRLAPWPAHWLAGYGDRASGHWLAFRKSAERHLDSAGERAEAAEAAASAFRSLSDWFRERGAA